MVYENKNKSIVSQIMSVLHDINSNIKNIFRCVNKKQGNDMSCPYMEMDETKIHKGYSIVINDDIKIRQPYLGEIVDYGESKYYGMIADLCAVGADLKWQLDDVGIDYTKIEDYDLFCVFISRLFNADRTSILFGDEVDFSKMSVVFDDAIQENVLVQFLDNGKKIRVDKYVYSSIVSVLRKMHRMKRNNEMPGNEATRLFLIEDAREEYEDNKDKPYKPYLLNLISAMVNSKEFKRDDVTVYDMKICAFMDSVYRITKIKTSELLLMSGYSGFGIDLKKISKDDTNWMGELK